MPTDTSKRPILKTKLYPPRLPTTVKRNRLLHRLEEAKTVRLTTIVAGAGYGKTTLAAQFIEHAGLPSAWYHLGPKDRDLSQFLTYLIHALRRISPEFGGETLAHLEAVDNVYAESDDIITTLIGEIDSLIKAETLIVLDEFQEAGDSAEIIHATEFFIENIPPSLHVIILSRAAPRLDLATIRTRRQLVELDEPDLVFLPDETSRLFSDVLGLPLNDEDIRRLSALTEGWVAGLVLCYLALKEKADDQIDGAIAKLIAPTTQLAEYLSRTAYESHGKETREFLIRTSILTRMNPVFCDELLGIGNSSEILQSLVEGRHFTTPLDDKGEWYRYSHFLRVFLQETLNESYPREEVVALNLKAASLWTELGDSEQALYHYMTAEDFEEAAGVLETIAADLRKTNRLRFFNSIVSTMPAGSFSNHPKLLLDAAQAKFTLGDYGDAQRAFRDAASLFEESGDLEGQARAMFGSAMLLGTSGEPEESRRLLARGMELLPEESAFRYQVIAVLAAEAAVSGVPDLADQFITEALENVDQVDDEPTRAGILFWCGLALFNRGNLRKAFEALSRSREILESISHAARLPEVYAVLGFTLTFLGDFEEGMASADKGIKLSEELGISQMATLNRAIRVRNLTLLGRHEEARKEIAAAGLETADYGEGMPALFTEFSMGQAYIGLGQREKAIEQFNRARRAARQNRFTILECMASLGSTGQSALAGNMDLGEARDALIVIRDRVRESGAELTLTMANFILAAVYARSGQKDEAMRELESAIELSEKNAILGAWVDWPDEDLALLAEVFAQGRHLDFLEKLFSIIGQPALDHLRSLAGSKDAKVSGRAKRLLEGVSSGTTEHLTIKMLGPFEVSRGGAKITSDSWKSKKALSVLKYLAANRERGLMARDILMELLWPGGSMESSMKNLNVALTAVRKTLEPDAARGESSYVITSGDSLRLELGDGGTIDYELYKQKLEQSASLKKAGDTDGCLDTMLEAARLYRGDLLSEDLYDDWCTAERERLKEEHVGLLEKIAAEYLSRSENEEALRFLEEATEADPGREEPYRAQMEVYSRMGNRAGVERTFKRCKQFLADLYDLAPSRETAELYERLRSSG